MNYEIRSYSYYDNWTVTTNSKNVSDIMSKMVERAGRILKQQEGYEMYGTIIIKIGLVQAQFKTWAHDDIYDFLTNHSYSHDIAADIAGWAELASVGEEYECDGATIIIVD